MQITKYHAKYYAHELTCLHSVDSVDRLSQSLFDVTVDLNPHQIEATLCIEATIGRFGKTTITGHLFTIRWKVKQLFRRNASGIHTKN